jgi:hypothetical protein
MIKNLNDITLNSFPPHFLLFLSVTILFLLVRILLVLVFSKLIDFNSDTILRRTQQELFD